MQFLKVPILGFAATVAYAGPEAACGSVSTVYVTVPKSQVTETFTLAAAAPSYIAGPESVSTSAAGVSATSSDATATATSYTTFTSLLSIAKDTSTSAVADQGPYFFNVNGGTTSWFGGKTPPSTASLVTSTYVVTVVPIPESSPVSDEGAKPTASDTPTTSYTTTFLTTVISKMHTETLTESVGSSAISAKIFSGLGSSGWNATYTTMRIMKTSEYGSGVFMAALPKTGINDEKHLPLLGSALTSLASSPSIGLTKYKYARQVGAIIDATIDGTIVSWTNSYEGSSTMTLASMSGLEVSMASSSMVPSVAPSSAVPVYPWQTSFSGPVVSTSAMSDTLMPGLTTTLPVYPWQLSFSGPNAPPVAATDTLTSVPTTTLPVYPWNSPPFSNLVSSISSISTSVGFPYVSGSVQPGISISQPTSNSVSTVSFPIVESSFPSQPNSVSRAPYSNTSTSTSTASTATIYCGIQTADFIVNFDDLPQFSTGATNTDIPPILNPYYKLFFEAGFGYVPPPSDPFPPISPPQLAVYRNYNSVKSNPSPDAGLLLPGELGAGPRASESAYWVDAYSTYLGCNNNETADCTITINGYNSTSSYPQVSQTTTQPRCPGLVNCHLGFVEFLGSFRNLSGIQFVASVAGQPVDWYMDDLALAWSNNTCAAQVERASAH